MRNRIAPGFKRWTPPSFEELKQGIDEEESNRLNPMDGYTPTPPRPREGFGLQLRPQHDDINEYFTGPKWHDRRSLEIAESRGLPPPYVTDEVLSREEGQEVRRPKPPPPPKVFTAKNILFEKYPREDYSQRKPAKFADRAKALREIKYVAKVLRENPNLHVVIRANAGWDSSDHPKDPEWEKAAMLKRAEAVSKELKGMGIDPARIDIKPGQVRIGAEYRTVDFEFKP